MRMNTLSSIGGTPARWTGLARCSSLLLIAAFAVGCGTDKMGGPGDESADVTVTLTGPEATTVGMNVEHEIAVRNSGPDDATSVEVTYEVVGGRIVSVDKNGTIGDGTVTWPTVSTLIPGATRLFKVTLTGDEGDATASASATSAVNDPMPSNNDGSSDVSRVTTSFGVAADVSVTLTGPLTGAAASEATFEATVENAGPSTAEEVVLSVELAPGAGFVSASDGGTFADGTVTWPAVDLEDGANATRTVTATVPAVGPATAVASAESPTNDPSAANNNGSASNARVRTLVTFTTLYTLEGEGAGDQFGFLMEHLGDLDGDGASDFVVTAPGYGGGAGRAYVYSGATGTELFRATGAAGEQLGSGVDLAGDIDDDGTPDVILGGTGTGTVRILSGADGSEIRAITGDAAEAFGFSVGRAGDVDGDGRDDVIVGAIRASSGAGRIYVYSGVDGALLFSHDPATGGAAFGAAVGSAGDLNADGHDDLLVGASDTPGGGRVYVLSGVDGSPLYPSIPPDATGSRLGQYWLESPGDLSGDGVPDIFASDIENSATAANTGRAYIFSGADGSLVWQATGDQAGAQFGIGRGANADADGDGVPDVFVAAWLHNEGGNQAGKAFLLSGADGSVLRTFTHTTAMDQLGYDAVGVGDLDGDGNPDFLLSGGLSTGPGKVLVVAGIPLD